MFSFINQHAVIIKKEHGRIIKWTQNIGFLTLAGMERVVEGNHGNDLKEG